MKEQGKISFSSRQPMVGVAIFFVLVIALFSLLFPREDILAERAVYQMFIEDDNELLVVAQRSEDGAWRAVGEQYYFRADSTLMLEAGDSLVAYASLRDFGGRRGFVYISENNVYEHQRAKVAQKGFFVRLGDVASERLRHLEVEEDTQALLQSMLLGRRGAMREQLRESYNHSGAAHLLAVSGLHVGIVMLVVSTLLLPLGLLNRGNALRDILIILAVGAYALVVGLSPSVERAALMFILLQISRLTLRSYTPLNALAAAVVLMLAFDAELLFNVGFQLSVVAVLAILIWALPMLRSISHFTRARFSNETLLFAVDALAAALVISFACSVATLPLISYYFGYISVFGVLISPLLMLTTYVLLMVALLWVLFPLPFLSTCVASVIDFCAYVQNTVVEKAAYSVSVRFRLSEVFLLYSIFALLTVLLHFRRSERENEIK